MSTGGFISGPAFARATLTGTAVVTLAAAGTAWQWDPSAARGLLIGGLAGGAGFWMMARTARRLPSIPKVEISYRIYRWTFARVLLYAIALIFAYKADPVGRNALLGAAGGLFIARAVMLVTGMVAWRLGK